MDPGPGRSRGVSQALAEPIESTAARERTSFEELYRSSRDDIYAYAAGFLRDAAAAEDVTAIAFERAYRNRSRFDPGRGSARGWLFGIARNARSTSFGGGAVRRHSPRSRSTSPAPTPSIRSSRARGASPSPAPWRASRCGSGSWSR